MVNQNSIGSRLPGLKVNDQLVAHFIVWLKIRPEFSATELVVTQLCFLTWPSLCISTSYTRNRSFIYNKFNRRYDTIRLQTIVITSFSVNQRCRFTLWSLPVPFLSPTLFGLSNTCFSGMESTAHQKFWQCTWKFTPDSTGAPKAKSVVFC